MAREGMAPFAMHHIQLASEEGGVEGLESCVERQARDGTWKPLDPEDFSMSLASLVRKYSTFEKPKVFLRLNAPAEAAVPEGWAELLAADQSEVSQAHYAVYASAETSFTRLT